MVAMVRGGAASRWVVTLVCGASGVGKSSVAVGLATRWGVPLAEADDIVTALQALTTPQQLPEVHWWVTHPEAAAWPAGRIADQHAAMAAQLRPGLRAVIADHLEFAAPVVFEGDYLTPDLAAGFDGRVRAVVLVEPEQGQLIANFATREPDAGVQRHRAAVSALIGARLAERARLLGQPVLPARPWHDATDRGEHALRNWRPILPA
jgi:2-phosphoglycerate kinase